MNPFLFGTSQEPLFGVYQPPKAQRSRETGIVLCYPMGQEYMRSHRAFRQLAMLLTKAGFHVLRFDYFGTGDSAGASDEISFDRWVRDASSAADELKDTTGITRVAFAGLRVGAAVAARAAAPRNDVECLVLWDPIVEGSGYVRELIRDQPADADIIGVLGFPLKRSMRQELAAVDLRSVSKRSDAKTLIIASEDRSPDRELRDALARTGSKVTYDCIPTSGNWNEVDTFGSALIPQAMIQRIVTFLATDAR
jgi:pimeloyl-ACP methyl ester carboxylesterase